MKLGLNAYYKFYNFGATLRTIILNKKLTYDSPSIEHIYCKNNKTKKLFTYCNKHINQMLKIYFGNITLMEEKENELAQGL